MAVSALKVFIFVWVCLAVPSTLAKSVSYCDNKGNYAIKVKGVDYTPDPVKAGKEAVFSISASSGEDIFEGQVVIDVSYFGIHVHKERIDLCEETSCPISAGDFVLSHKQTLPSYTPPGSYTLKLRIEDRSKTLMTCVTFGFSISIFGASVSYI